MPAADDLAKRLDALWHKHLRTTEARLEILDRALGATARGNLSQDLRNEAVHAAHKLAGSLGTFGLSRCSRIASNVEELLQRQALDPSSILKLKRLLQQLKRNIQKRNT